MKNLFLSFLLILSFCFSFSQSAAILLNGTVSTENNQIKNVKDGNYKVYDPTSVLLDSITNAVTVANSLLSIKGIIYNNLVVKG